MRRVWAVEAGGISSRPAQSHTVLVVEDEPLVRMVLAEEIRDAGYRVLEAASAEEARRFVRADGSVAVVVSDVNLPGTDGFSFARWLRGEYPDLPLILTSGDPANAAESNKIARFLHKPYPPGCLIALIGKLLAAASGPPA